MGAQEAFLEGACGVETDGLVSLTKEELLCIYQKIVRAKTFSQNCEIHETGILSPHLPGPQAVPLLKWERNLMLLVCYDSLV